MSLICQNCRNRVLRAVDEYGFFYVHVANDHEDCPDGLGTADPVKAVEYE